MPGAARFGGRLQPALACATDPMVLGTRTVSAVAELGRLLSEHGFPGEALPLLERAQALGLDTPILGYLIGLCRVYTGEPERAEAELLACLRAEPGMPLALWALGKLRLREVATSVSASSANPSTGAATAIRKRRCCTTRCSRNWTAATRSHPPGTRWPAAWPCGAGRPGTTRRPTRPCSITWKSCMCPRPRAR